MGKGKKNSDRKAKKSSGNAESGTSYTAANNAGVSGVLNGVPGPLLIGVSGLELLMGLVYIIIGSMNVEDCKVEPMIPIWLILMGVAMVLTGLHEFFHFFRKSATVGHGRSLASLIFTGVLVLMIVGFFIAGNVFIYTAWSIPPDYGHYWMDNGCDHATFNLAFISIIFMDALFGVLVLSILFYAIYQVFK